MSKPIKRLRVGHIGWLANDQNDHAQTVAWCDTNKERIQKACARNPEIKGCTDYREMLRDADLDLVVIATPNWVHCEMACDFLKAGVHVFLEKPMGINREEIDRLHAEALASKAQLAIDFELRISGLARFVKNMLESGGLGALRRMELVHHRGGWLEEGNGIWRTRPEKSGGLFLMEPIHAIDFFRMLAGEVSAVQSLSGPNVLGNYRFPDNACTNLLFSNGIIATILTSHTLSAHTNNPKEWIERGHDMRWVFTFSQGSVLVDILREKILINRYEVYPEGTNGTRVVFDREQDFEGQGAAFYHDITSMRLDFIRRCALGEKPLQDIGDARRTHLVCLAAEESALSGGRRIELEPYTNVSLKLDFASQNKGAWPSRPS